MVCAYFRLFGHSIFLGPGTIGGPLEYKSLVLRLTEGQHGDMSIHENLVTRKIVSEVSGSADRVAEARKVLWSFPTRGEGARRGRELGQQIVAVAFAGDIVVILSALLLTFYIRF